MPQIKKKGAIFPIFADSPSPPRAASSGASTSLGPSASPTRPGAVRKNSLASAASIKAKSTAAPLGARKALSQKSTGQVSLGASRHVGLGKGKAAEGKPMKAEQGKFIGTERIAPPKSAQATSHAPPAHRGHVRSATESSVYAGRPNLRKKPAPSGSFGVFADENSSAPLPPRKVEVKPSPVRLAAPIALSPADKENRPPAREAPVPELSASCAPADVFGQPVASSSAGVLDLEALGNALMGSTIPPAESSQGASSRSMTLGYGRGRRASRPLQSAFSAAGVPPMDTEAAEILEDEEDAQLDPSLLPAFQMGTPVKRTTHSRTSSTQSIQESPSKWPAAVLSTSTATPLKRHRAPKARASPVGADVVGLGIGFGGAGGLDMRFQPDPVLGDVSDVYGADRSVEPRGFRAAGAGAHGTSRQQTHAQKDSWSGAWGADLASYPTARRS